MKRIIANLFILLILGFIISCTKDDDTTLISKYESSGTFVINEGAFTDGVGTLDFLNLDSNKVFLQTYQTENNGSTLGSIAQSMNIIDDNAYVVINNGGKVVVMDKSTLEKKGEITGLDLPQYIIEGKNDELYVSQYGSTGSNGSVKVVNSKTFVVTSSIDVGGGPEHMLLFDNNLYVANSGGYGRANTIVMVNPNTNEVSNEIEVGDIPLDILLDRNQELWVLCAGYSDWMDSSNNTMGQLVHIVNNDVVKMIEVPTGARDLCFNKSKDIMYFSVGPYGAAPVYKHSITSTTFDNTIFIDEAAYSVDFNTYTDEITIGIANGNSNGEVVTYNEDGQKTSSFQGGVYPGSFFFVK